jgi:endonuclease/exonuclease/phosphatase family metal-dependent hydrolase
MTDATRRVCVLTWNIHGGVGSDGRYDIERTGRFIGDLAPDIAAFQEVDLRRPSQTQHDICRYLRGQVGEHGHEAWTISGADGKYGQMLASRYPLTEQTIHDISIAGREPRNVIEVWIEMPAGRLRVIATHLGLRRAERGRQIDRLREIISADLSAPLVLLGDFNEWRRGQVVRALSDLFDARTAHRTFPARFPVLALDRIMCRAGPRLAGSRAAREAYRASDHLPVVAGIVLPAS